MSVVDDYGRFYANPGTIRGSCWPTHHRQPSEKDVLGWIQECTGGSKPLIIVYRIDDCDYLQIVDFNQKIRSKSKFPQYDGNLSADCGQSADNCGQNASTMRNAYCVMRNASIEDEHRPDTAAEPPEKTPDELIEGTTKETARGMCSRHPKKRTCGPKEAEGLLRSIINRVPKSERIHRLSGIDKRHEGWCKSEEWTKDDGEYARGLANWLAPTKGRYDQEPPPPSAPKPIAPRSMSSLDMILMQSRAKQNV
jgi:hypothetical protein